MTGLAFEPGRERPPPRAAHGAVVVALDGSPAAATALPLAQGVARQLGARVETLHVAAVAPADHLETLLSHGPAAGAVRHLRWATGDPVAGILEALADPHVETVVLATHAGAIHPGGHLGRVAEAVIARAPRQILLVRPEAAAARAAARGELRRLLLPLDGSPATAAALQPATELAARLGAAIDLLYVLDPHQPPLTERGSLRPPRYADQAHHEWSAWAREIVDRLSAGLARCPVGVPVRLHLGQGEAAAAIVEFATRHETDLIALVRRSRLEPGRAAILRAVLDATPCPILLCAGACG